VQNADSATCAASDPSHLDAWRVPEGSADRGTAKFRDPPPDPERAILRADLARALVGAPEIPVDLKLFGLRLLDVSAKGGIVSLLIGSPDPIAELQVRPKAASDLLTLGAPVIDITLRALHVATAERFARELETMRARLATALTRARWEAALPVVQKLERARKIPLEHLRQLIPGTRAPEGLVRTGFRCNQDCGLCWQGREWGGFGPSQIRTWIEDLRDAGAENLSISGGEPTLDDALEGYVRHARAVGFQSVMLQTNAIRFAKPGYAEAIRAAGLDLAFVSLHSGDPAVSDAITRAPGTHARTVLGIERLLETGITVDLNCVMTPESLPTLAELPAFVHRSFGKHPKLLGLVLTVPMAPFDGALAPSIVPDPRILRAKLREALDRATELGVRIHDLDGPCGPQLCSFGADPRFASLGTKAPLEFRRYLPACDRCTVRGVCFGVRGEQIDRFGEACVDPIGAWPAEVPS
jgi:Radical SAM superfamily